MIRRLQHKRPPPRRGFTLFDLLMTITVIGVVAAIVAPALTDNQELRLTAASRILRSDIEMAQVMNISFPDDPVVVRFDPAAHSYWLALAASPNTPIARQDNGHPYLVVLGEDRAAGAAGITFTLADATNDTIAFNAMGGIDDLTSSPQVTLQSGSRWIKLSLAATTGSITESAGVVQVTPSSDGDALVEASGGAAESGGGVQLAGGLVHSVLAAVTGGDSDADSKSGDSKSGDSKSGDSGSSDSKSSGSGGLVHSILSGGHGRH